MCLYAHMFDMNSPYSDLFRMKGKLLSNLFKNVFPCCHFQPLGVCMYTFATLLFLLCIQNLNDRPLHIINNGMKEIETLPITHTTLQEAIHGKPSTVPSRV